MMDRILKDKLFWLALMAGVVVFYILNLNTALWGDDIMYAFMPDDVHQRCDSVGKYIASMPAFYQTVNGRIADMMLRFTCSLLGEQVFNIMNTIVFGIMVYTLSTLIGVGRRLWVVMLVYVYLLLFFPYPGETMTWMAGAFNYLWSCTATLLVVKYIVNHNDEETWHAGALKHALVAVGAFIAGGMNESFSSATAAGLVCYFLFNRKKLRGTNVTILVAYIAGLALIMLSPAAWQRLDDGYAVNMDMSLMQLATQRGFNLVTKTFHFVTPLLGWLTLAVMVWEMGIKRASQELRHWILAGCVVSILVFGVFAHRAYTCYSVMGFVVMTSALASIINRRELVTRVVAVVCAVACIYPAAIAVKYTHACRQYDDQVLASVLASPEGVVKVTKAPPASRYYHNQDYDSNLSSWRNVYLGYYYGKENVQFVKDSVYAHYRSERPFTEGSVERNYASMQPQWAGKIVEFKAAGFSLVQLADSTLDVGTSATKLYYDDLEAHMGRDRASQSQKWGTYKGYEKYLQYMLKRDGAKYVVLPVLNDSVCRVVIPVIVNEKDDSIVFNRR